jgi:hypothetical protein
MGEAYSAWGKKINACKMTVGKLEWKRPVGHFRHRWNDNIKMYLMVEICGSGQPGDSRWTVVTLLPHVFTAVRASWADDKAVYQTLCKPNCSGQHLLNTGDIL